jgi:signal peptidase I
MAGWHLPGRLTGFLFALLIHRGCCFRGHNFAAHLKWKLNVKSGFASPYHGHYQVTQSRTASHARRNFNLKTDSNRVENLSPVRFFTTRLNPIAEETLDDLKTVFASFFFAVFVRVLLFEPRFIPSLSMFPTFDIGDQLLVDKISHINHHYSKKDVVVFEPSEVYIDMTGNTNALIKRVVAVGGDTVEVKNCKLYINGIEQTESYINEQPDYSLSAQVVPPGMLMLLGDNRNHSFDSHIWGFLPEKNVIGRAVVRYWPPKHIGFIEGSD